jgi:hypothetical protein
MLTSPRQAFRAGRFPSCRGNRISRESQTTFVKFPVLFYDMAPRRVMENPVTLRSVYRLFPPKIFDEDMTWRSIWSPAEPDLSEAI